MESRFLGSIAIQRIARGYLGRGALAKIRAANEISIFHQCKLGNKQIVEDLFAGFNTEETYTIYSCDWRGDTVFLCACRWGHKKIMRKCLRWGMEMNHLNDDGRSGLKLAVLNGHDKCAEYLISKKAKFRKYGRNLLHEAAKRGLEATGAALLAKGVDINEKDNTHTTYPDATALHESASEDMLRMCRFLLDSGAYVDAPCRDGTTALHIAATKGYGRIVDILLEYGADVSLKDGEKRTPWRCALSNGFEYVAQVLRSHWSGVAGGEGLGPDSTAGVPEADQARYLACARSGDAAGLEEIKRGIEAGLPCNIEVRGAWWLLFVACSLMDPPATLFVTAALVHRLGV